MVKEIPTYDEFMLPILKFLKDNKERKTKEIIEAMCAHFEFSDEQKKQLTPSGKQTTIYNRCQWAIKYLKQAELIKPAQRGLFYITENGLDIIKDKDRKGLSVKDLKNCSKAFSEFYNNNRRNYTEEESEINPTTQNETPEEILYAAYQIIRDNLKEDLLEKIRTISPSFFERLVVDLLVKMGYGGPGDGKQIGKVGDEGIDGIIKEDKLGLDIVYIQAKRWKENNKVGRPEIQGFVGALAGKGAKKGIFITASDFTEDAKKYEPKNEIKIVLINGEELANLMIDYDLGVSIQDSYKIKRMDSDYFEE